MLTLFTNGNYLIARSDKSLDVFVLVLARILTTRYRHLISFGSNNNNKYSYPNAARRSSVLPRVTVSEDQEERFRKWRLHYGIPFNCLLRLLYGDPKASALADVRTRRLAI